MDFKLSTYEVYYGSISPAVMEMKVPEAKPPKNEKILRWSQHIPLSSSLLTDLTVNVKISYM